MSATGCEPQEKIAAVTAIYNKVGVADCCREQIGAFYAEGLECLDRVSVEAARKQPLKEYVCQLMDRQL